MPKSIDLAQLTQISALTVLAVAILTSLISPLLEQTFLPKTAKLHDAIIRLIAVAIGILIVVASTLALAPHGANGPLVLSAVGGGIASAVFSMAVYHVVTSNFFDGTDIAGQVTDVLKVAAPPEIHVTASIDSAAIGAAVADALARDRATVPVVVAPVAQAQQPVSGVTVETPDQL